MKHLSSAILAACLFTAAGAASATAFSVTGAVLTPGAGYGIDSSEQQNANNTPTLLDVRFSTAGFGTQNFNLITVGDFYSFNVGTVSFQEPNDSQGIRTAETDSLGVSLALNFAAPGAVTNTLIANGAAVIGSVTDTAIDYTLTWSPVTAAFGTNGLYTISFATLAFDGVSTQNLVGRVTLTSAATATNVPEPGSVALLSIGLLGAGVLRRRTMK
jgi:hypothetical protein